MPIIRFRPLFIPCHSPGHGAGAPTQPRGQAALTRSVILHTGHRSRRLRSRPVFFPRWRCLRPTRLLIATLTLSVLILGLPSTQVSPSHGTVRADTQFYVHLPSASRAWTGVFPPMGISWYDWTPDDVAVVPEQARLAGARWILAKPVLWSVVQPSEPAPGMPPSYNWGPYDAALAAPAASGLTPIGLVSVNPEWARDPSFADRASGPIAAEHVDDFVAFVKAAIAHYSASPYNVKHWIIYGEPDCSNPALCNYYGHWGDVPERYAALLAQLYPAVKADYPGVTIIMGNLAMDWFSDRTENPGPFERHFLENVLVAGGGQYVDAFAFNYFPEHASEWAPYGPDILGKVNYIRSIIAAKYPNGANKKLLCTEIAALGSDSLLDEQARYITKLYARTHAGGLDAVLYLGTKEWYLDTEKREGPRGLLNEFGQPKPAYIAYQYYASTMASTTYLGPVSDADLGLAPGTGAVEGYRFRRMVDGNETWVLWANQSRSDAVVHASSVTLTSKVGQSLPTVDLGGGAFRIAFGSDYGQVPVGDPVYLELSR